MAKIFGRNVKWRKNADAGSIFMKIVHLIIWMLVGNLIINSMRTILQCNTDPPGTDCSTSVFYIVYVFMGIVGATPATGIISIIGLLLGVRVLMSAFSFNR